MIPHQGWELPPRTIRLPSCTHEFGVAVIVQVRDAKEHLSNFGLLMPDCYEMRGAQAFFRLD
jgi:hypothetical protein